ncbi:MAG: hypothetical protein HY795_02350 [Desulfovibrio sp.]|nr:hypothetical protein [Desulfovibrio sp.]
MYEDSHDETFWKYLKDMDDKKISPFTTLDEWSVMSLLKGKTNSGRVFDDSQALRQSKALASRIGGAQSMFQVGVLVSSLVLILAGASSGDEAVLRKCIGVAANVAHIQEN